MQVLEAGLTMATVLGVIATATSNYIEAASTQICESLAAVGSGRTAVTKTIDRAISFEQGISSDISRNTDFIVPSGGKYSAFVIGFLPEAGETYSLDIHLKYPDGSWDAAYSVHEANFAVGELVEITVKPRFSSRPYGVNLQVNSANARENTYTVSVWGCR
ncbi:MAG: hypothetical protein F6J97_07985 [Leptolyngbya sp. SIO4C1]|nr:hypothetical protein [Leptolyngbya sp. SIO4C1]